MTTARRFPRPLDSRQLVAFVTVARTRSFTRAGKELFLSQSAVSHALKSLEEDVGFRLLDRSGKKMRLTPAGEHLLHYAEKILSDMSAAQESLERRGNWGKGRLRVGATHSVCQCLLPDILCSFRREYPDWPVGAEAGDTRQCVEWLRQGRIDLAIAIAPNNAEPVEMVPLFTDELLWIVSPDHPWARAGAAVFEEIPAQTFICNSAGSYGFRQLEKHFEREGVQPRPELEMGSLEGVKEMVKRGVGVAVMAAWMVRKEILEKSLAALPMGKRKLKREWCLLRSRDHKPGLAEETFVKLSVEVANSISSLMRVTVTMAQIAWIAVCVNFGGFPVEF